MKSTIKTLSVVLVLDEFMFCLFFVRSLFALWFVFCLSFVCSLFFIFVFVPCLLRCLLFVGVFLLYEHCLVDN